MEIEEVRKLIRRELNILLYAQTGTTTSKGEIIEQLYPGMPNTETRPRIQPYGVSSRAPRGTISFTARVGDHPGNRVILGHQHNDRPDPNAGGTILYDAHGHQIKLQEEGMEFEANGVKLLENLIKFFKEVRDGYVFTSLGPQQYLSDHQSVFTEVIEALEGMKGSL